MAANLQSGRAAAKGIARRIAAQTKLRGEGARRHINISAAAYDKNPDEPVSASAVPDELLEPHSDKYWGPNPKTGVFGPDGRGDGASSTARNGHSVMEQEVWFRPLEDVQMPPPPP